MEIRARSLTFSYPAPGPFGLSLGRRTAVRDVDLAAVPGEVVALAGENGSGKSTTLRLLAGLLKPDSGEALLGGIVATNPSARLRLGYVAEMDDFPAGLTVRATLGYAAALAGLRGPRARREVGTAAETAGLERWLDVPAARCSRGIRRRVSLAQALVGRPGALLLDEPLTGLDPVARVRSIAAIRRAAARGAAVVVSLHDAAATAALAHRLLVLADGAVAAAGPLEDFTAAGADPPGSGPGDWLAGVLGARNPGLP